MGGLEKYTENNKSDVLVMSHEKPYFLERIFDPNSGGTKKNESSHNKITFTGYSGLL